MTAVGDLVAGDGHRVGIDEPEVDPVGQGGAHDLGAPAGHAGGHRVEEVVVDDRHAVDPAQTGGEGGGQPAGSFGDGAQALGAVVHGVHRGDHGQQDLGRADVAGGLLPADVLLAGLEGEPVGRVAVGVDRHADQPSGQRPLEPVAHRHEPGVGAAVPERDPEALGRSHDHVGAGLARVKRAG